MVLRHIHEEAPISRANIAQQIGLNKSTVSSLVESLLEWNLVHEVGKNSVGAGRPARLLEVNPKACSIIGILFGVDFISVALTDFAGNLIWRCDEPAEFQDEQHHTLEQTLDLISQAVEVSQEQDIVLFGLGVAVPGIINLEKGEVVFAPNMQWRDVPLQEYLSKNTGLRVYVENDANAAAVAEYLFGSARKCEDFIFLTAGFGIGSGLFLNGSLYRGNIGYAGEIGHSPIMAEPLRKPCHCGNYGCWEVYTNQDSVIQRVQSRLDKNEESTIPQLMAETKKQLSISIIKQAADEGDAIALNALKDTGAAMGIGLVTFINILNPEKIILGGPLSVVGEYLLPGIRESMAQFVFGAIKPEIEIAISNFGRDSSLIGAASIVVDRILSNPTQI